MWFLEREKSYKCNKIFKLHGQCFLKLHFTVKPSSKIIYHVEIVFKSNDWKKKSWKLKGSKVAGFLKNIQISLNVWNPIIFKGALKLKRLWTTIFLHHSYLTIGGVYSILNTHQNFEFTSQLFSTVFYCLCQLLI